ncbi:rhodanese-like domain-containing protein [Chitiniphilus purpureus]|uniref:Rhodanese-like domain-containing protein n=1 Tax=Chitiniphilus purpureus TaxID=2981137 RepID=A0ABY6DNE5_9NEIS|nr:rhodanese-like domain-containing protein [Chitiniphilus sp. CD1]UXY15890.1 rhodanese-like domain-containing protein [Chitiniphilus sp. CD1]
MSSPLVSAAQAHALSQARFLDVRARLQYEAGQMPGAIHLEPRAWRERARNPATGLDQTASWAAELTRLGLHGPAPVVVYDDGSMTEAARAWFILQLSGVTAFVVNGGAPALLGTFGSHEEAIGITAPVSARLVEKAVLAQQVAARTARIWDARTPAEFEGSKADSYARGGHIPGGINIDHRQCFDDTGLIKPPQALRAILCAAGFDPGQQITTHCGSGGRGSFAGLVAAAAGFEQVGVYYQGFSEWAADSTLAVETGA